MHPILIAGAALVGLPIVLHLILKQEPKRLVFPALRFLKQKQKTSERKMRLRHLLLLALRCLLIALFALTLYQPTVRNTGVLDLSGEQPVAAVLILDTSPSMGYKAGGAGPSRLDEARRRALDFLDELPKSSRVAVVDPNDPVATWEPTPLEARKRIEGLKEPGGYAPPVTTSLAVAYQLLKSADQDAGDQADPLPRLIAVFSDRTAGSWDASRVEELKKLRDAVPPPAPVQIFFDIGEGTPSNVAIVSATVRPQRLSGSADAVVSVAVRADGVAADDSGKVDAELTATLDGGKAEQQVLPLAPGRPAAATFRFGGLGIGFHTVEVRLTREDGLAFDNARTITFEVAPPRKILTVSDTPDAAAAWQDAHNFGKQEFDCAVVTPDRVTDFAGYEAVTLLGVKAPDERLAKLLTDYVTGGGKLLLIPDGPDSAEGDGRAEAYNAALATLLPADLGKIRTWTPDPADAARKNGVPWKLDDDRDLAHPLLAPLRGWRRQGNVDVFDPNRRRVAVRYRETGGLHNAAVVAYFDDSDDPTKRTPAVLERAVEKGTVLLLTTRFDAAAGGSQRFWNDYAMIDHSWATLMPWLLVRHLCGSPDDAAYNFPTGQDVTTPVPPFPPGVSRRVIVEGPGIAPGDAVVELGERQTELRLTPPKTLAAGAYTVRTADEKALWAYRFSLNTAADESGLEKVPEEAVTDLFGKNGVATVDRAVDFRSLMDLKFDQPVELFPLLVLLVLIFFAFEGLVANRFYKLR
jgi:hypothetical protein